MTPTISFSRRTLASHAPRPSHTQPLRCPRYSDLPADTNHIKTSPVLPGPLASEPGQADTISAMTNQGSNVRSSTGTAANAGGLPAAAQPAQPPSAPLAGARPGSIPQAPPANAPKRVRTLYAARLHMRNSEWAEAAKELAPLTKGKRRDGEALYLLASCLERTDQINQARKFVEQALTVMPHLDAKLLLARCLRQAGETDACLKLCQEVLNERPGKSLARLIRVGAMEEAGRFDDAVAELAPLLEGPEADTIRVKLEHAKLLVQKKQYDEAISVCEEVLQASDGTESTGRVVYPLLAKACDRSKRYADAFDAATKANEIGRVEYQPKIHREQVAVLIENWSADRMKDYPVSACESQVPVFVAGMPRSGTSLIDQIIDAHPKAAGVGELNTIEQFAGQLSKVFDPTKPPGKQFGKFDSYRWTRVAEAYVKEILEKSPDGVERVVNKALGNNKLVGLLARLFPKTRVIHAMRDPRDVAVSCYMGGFNNNLHPWTTRLDWTSMSWDQSHRMMQHWKDTLDIEILDVHYEALVSDPETQFPRIIEFLGLEWDDACYDFHKSKRTVRTLSYDQVNRPIYTTSAGRNANYAKFLEGIDFADYDPFADAG